MNYFCLVVCYVRKIANKIMLRKIADLFIIALYTMASNIRVRFNLNQPLHFRLLRVEITFS